MSITSFLDYLRYERYYSDKTIGSYGEDLNQFRSYVQEKRGFFDPADVKPDWIREWIVSLMDEKYASTSVNRKLSSLRSFYKFLLKKNAVPVNPLLKIAGPKNKKPLPVFLKERDMNRLLDDVDFGEEFEGVRNRLIIEVFYATGMRLSELIGLDDKDVDMSACRIKVTGKRNKQRLIPFGDELKHSLQTYVDLRDRSVSYRSTDAFWVKANGERLKKDAVYGIVRRSLSKVVTLKKRSPHVLRHTFATTMLNNHAELRAVKELLGHENLATTEIYTHTTFEELKKVYKQAHPRAEI